jgi:hypothetical protein
MPRRTKHEPDAVIPIAGFAPLPVSGSLEGMMRRLSQIMQERAPESTEEANAMIGELLESGQLDPSPADTPLEQAQELAYDAWETDSPRRRTALAREALALSPDCADAYLVLAEEERDVAKRHALVLEAVAAGLRPVADTLEQLVAEGHVWLALETRPYMRALGTLADLEWTMGDRQAALARGWEMLRLNPNDNQGMRYVLLLRLLQAGSLADIERLLSMNADESSAAWTFGRALHLFRTRGVGAESNAALAAAKRSNHHVVPYLLGERVPPDEPIDYIGFGDETEAAAYTLDALSLWMDTPGALEWLESRRGASSTPGRKRKKKR